MVTMTKEEIARASAHRYSQAFAWLISSEREILRYCLEQTIDELNPPSRYRDAVYLLEALKLADGV